MKAALGLLTTRMAYEVPPQDLSIDLARMPAIPADRTRLRNIRMLRGAEEMQREQAAVAPPALSNRRVG